MNNIFQRAIIIGSGYSLNEGIKKGLWSYLDSEITFGMNYIYKFYKSTIPTFVDWEFYWNHKEELLDYPLIIGKKDPKLGTKKYPIYNNLIMLKHTGNYYGNKSLELGIYSGILVGLFTLTLVIALGFKEIFLLGYDFGGIDQNGQTHFYKNLIHENPKIQQRMNKGIGKNKQNCYNTNIYDKNPSRYFDVYKNELNNIKIINVSETSRIDLFPKITYSDFFKYLEKNPIVINKLEVIPEIQNKIERYKK